MTTYQGQTEFTHDDFDFILDATIEVDRYGDAEVTTLELDGEEVHVQDLEDFFGTASVDRMLEACMEDGSYNA